MNKYTKIYEMANKKHRASWFDTAIMALAADLGELTGEEVVVGGPYGLRAEVSIKVGDKYLVVTPEFPDDSLTLYYDTGRTEPRYQPQTHGDWNGFNNIREKLPDTAAEIVKLLRK